MVAGARKRKPQVDWRQRWQRAAPAVWALAFAGIVAGAGAAGGHALSDPQLLPIRTVAVHGELRHLEPGTLRQAVAPHVTGGFFTADVHGAHRAAASLPWVDRVTVRRVWPDRVELRVVEHRPEARWNDHALLNRRGELFQPPDADAMTDLPRLMGPEGSHQDMLKHYRDMREAVRPLGVAIQRLEQDERRAWRLRLDNDIELMLGRENAYHRLLRFIHVYPQVLERRAGSIGRVDMRYTNGFAIRWHGERPDQGTEG